MNPPSPPGGVAAVPIDLANRLGDSTLDENEFTTLCVEVLRAVAPEAQVSKVAPLRTVAKTPSVEMLVSFENPWRAPPTERAVAVWAQARQLKDAVEVARGRLVGEAREIVPLARGEVDAAVQQIMAGAGTQVGERIAGDLWILYSFNKPTLFVPVTEDDLRRLKLDRVQLRTLALQNLRSLLPPVRRQTMGTNGTWALILPQSGGNFEASLLVDDDAWSALASEVAGELVAVAPARDLLFVTGSRNVLGLEQISATARDAFGRVDHPVSKQLLVRRRGIWEPFVVHGGVPAADLVDEVELRAYKRTDDKKMPISLVELEAIFRKVLPIEVGRYSIPFHRCREAEDGGLHVLIQVGRKDAQGALREIFECEALLAAPDTERDRERVEAYLVAWGEAVREVLAQTTLDAPFVGLSLFGPNALRCVGTRDPKRFLEVLKSSEYLGRLLSSRQ